MTFILSIRTTEGIILAADSKELLQGGYLMWEDFEKLLKQKNEDETSDKQCKAPAELGELFQSRSSLTKGRIRSIEGVRKTFRITDHIAISLSGKSNPGDKSFRSLPVQSREGKGCKRVRSNCEYNP